MTINNADFDYIRKLVRDRTGVMISEDKTYLIESRLAMLAREAGANSVSGFLSQLRQKPSYPLYQPIVEAMMTTETFFFRDELPFQAVKTFILPELLQKRQDQYTLKIWCAACSTGQEPYSIAMLLREHFPQLSSWTVQLLASDISSSVLERANSGRYNHHEIRRGLSESLLKKYFQPFGNEWQIREDIRQMVEFRQLNLTETFVPIPQMDIIFLRNVLIYFDLETKKTILTRVRQILQPDGYLFLGGGETTVNLDDTFEPVQFQKTVCYRKRTRIP